jgi:alpha-1,3-rhamnosyl/mannosyltransferase
VLYVGSIFNRRHVPDLIQAVGDLTRRYSSVSLDLVGDNRSYPHQDIPTLIDRQHATNRMRWHRYVTDEELGRLYRTAGAFAFLSEYEGLGLTPLEALAVGVPSVLLDTPVARESCGGAALYVGRDDVAGTADALARILFDAETRQRLLSAAPAVVACYNWSLAARQTLATLEGAL